MYHIPVASHARQLPDRLDITAPGNNWKCVPRCVQVMSDLSGLDRSDDPRSHSTLSLISQMLWGLKRSDLLQNGDAHGILFDDL
jgi:hypothetical protein